MPDLLMAINLQPKLKYSCYMRFSPCIWPGRQRQANLLIVGSIFQTLGLLVEFQWRSNRTPFLFKPDTGLHSSTFPYQIISNKRRADSGPIRGLYCRPRRSPYYLLWSNRKRFFKNLKNECYASASKFVKPVLPQKEKSGQKRLYVHLLPDNYWWLRRWNIYRLQSTVWKMGRWY